MILAVSIVPFDYLTSSFRTIVPHIFGAYCKLLHKVDAKK